MTFTNPVLTQQTMSAVKATARRMMRPWSPWQPREEHGLIRLLERLAEKAVFATEELEQALADYGHLADAAERVRTLEHEADDIVHATMALLNQTRHAPLPREDVPVLVHALDDTLDHAFSVLERLRLYRIDAPIPYCLAMATALRRSAEQARQAVSGLCNLSDEPGVLVPCARIAALEREADALNRQALGELFNSGYSSITIVTWRDIYKDLETAVDCGADIADVLESIVIKSRR